MYQNAEHFVEIGNFYKFAEQLGFFKIKFKKIKNCKKLVNFNIKKRDCGMRKFAKMGVEKMYKN